MQYHEQLKHPLWQKKRLEVMERNGFRCEKCEREDDQLNIHHPFYKRGAMLWQYEPEELMCLCAACHKDEHAKDEEIKRLLAFCTHSKGNVIGYLKAINDSPYTKLNDSEEIAGYLDCYGVYGETRRIVDDALHGCGGEPEKLLNGFNCRTSMYAVAEIVSPKTFDIETVICLASVLTKKMIEESRKEREALR